MAKFGRISYRSTASHLIVCGVETMAAQERALPGLLYFRTTVCRQEIAVTGFDQDFTVPAFTDADS
jgi:hypothetical protein